MARRSNIARENAEGGPVVVHSPVDRSRIGVYSAIGAVAGGVPLPWVPDALLRRVRGALVHDVAVRHGLSLTRDAREVLAEPSGPDGPRGIVSQVLRFVGIKLAVRTLARFGPIGLVWPVRTAMRLYVLGHLFDRYLEIGRTDRAVRVDVEEARRVRQAIDGALARALTVDGAPAEEPAPIDDQRDAVTILVDGVLCLAAGAPARVVRRVETAFDDLLAHAHG